MNYLETIPENEIRDYEIVSDWNEFGKKNIILNPGFINVSKKIFLSDVTFTSEYKIDIVFKNCYFQRSISFGNCKFQKPFQLLNCSIAESIINTGCPTFTGGLFLSGINANKIEINKGSYGNSFWNIDSLELLVMDGGEFNILDIKVAKSIRNIVFLSNSLKGEIFIKGEDSNIRTFNLKGTSKTMALSLNNLTIEYLGVYDYRNEGGLRLSNIKAQNPESKITIANSYLGKAEFNSINFRDFKSVILDSTHLVDCSFNNIQWSDNVEGATPLNQQDKKVDQISNYNSKSRETFRQLKYAMSKQGDIINEQKFHSKEMGMYFELLNWKENFWTKLIIYLSHLTSDFGQSFWRPLVFIFVFHTLFFLPLLFGFFPEFRISITEFSFPAFWKGLNTYLFLMNPLRKPDQETFYGGWICIDVLMRISSSYMIYNMIRATRRFIK